MQDWRIHTVQQLRAGGWTRAALTEAVEGRRLWRIRKGYYAFPDAERPIVRTVRLGGRATAATALRAWGAWTVPDEPLHVLVPANGSRLSDPDHRFEPLERRSDVHVHWQLRAPVRPGLLAYAPVVEPLLALEHMLGCATSELVIATCDSALNRRLLLPSDIVALQARLPRSVGSCLDECDGRAQSGAESLVRVRLRARGMRVEPQVRMDGVGDVDLLAEDRLVIETDGRAYHEDPKAFENDRRRDRELAIGGYRVLRFSQYQVLSEWPRCEAAVRAALAA